VFESKSLVLPGTLNQNDCCLLKWDAQDSGCGPLSDRRWGPSELRRHRPDHRRPARDRRLGAPEWAGPARSGWNDLTAWSPTPWHAVSVASGTAGSGSWWDRFWYGPLMVLPYPARHATAMAVMRGRPISEPDRVDVAVQYAKRQTRRYALLSALFTGVLVIFVAATIVDPSFDDLAGISALGLAPISLLNLCRARRFLRQPLIQV
jgi:hypothetical protein